MKVEIQKIEPLKCPECKSTEVEKKIKVIKCYECKKEFNGTDKPKSFNLNKVGSASGRNTSRYQMGDYYDHKGI
jgi:ribosomal protein L37AE/L43A